MQSRHWKTGGYHARIAEPLKKQAIEAYKAGASAKAAGELIGASEACVLIWVRRLGTVRTNHRDVAHDFFEKIDTEAKAYWLGWILTDGAITRSASGSMFVKLGVAIRDIATIEAFKQAIGSGHKIHIRERTRSSSGGANFNGQPFATIAIGSQKMVADLAALGVGPRKSLTVEPPFISPHLSRHFWRGVIDGNGCIYLNEKRGACGVQLSGSLHTCNAFATYVHDIVGRIVSIRQDGLIYRGSFRGRAAANFCREIYRDATMWLERKKLKADELISRYPSEK